MNELEISDEDIDRLVIEDNASIGGMDNHWEFDESRRDIIRNWDDVQACPGSGKTTLVAAKLLILAKKWKELHRGVCILTHTNVACNEIIEKLQKNPSGFKLTTYPHFVGTIQEFVDKFLGLPYIRSQYEFKRLIGDSEGKSEVRNVSENTALLEICKFLYHPCNKAPYEEIIDFLGSLHFFSVQDDLRFYKKNNISVESLASSNSKTRRMLSNLKEELSKAGIFHFRDIYVFAEKVLNENPDLIGALRKRFPVILIDEMQDTQKFQDELLCRIFDYADVHFQRLGDPDQAIFDGIGSEEPNETYNPNNDQSKIETSHRFGNDIGEKIIGLSYSYLPKITSIRALKQGSCKHTIFLYDDVSCEKVLEAFGDLVDQSDPDKNWDTIKAIGGVDGPSRRIKRYWSQFDKSKSTSNPRPQKLIHAANLCAGMVSGHVFANYNLLLQAVVDLLRKANKKIPNLKGNQVYFSQQTLKRWLRERKIYDDFRKLMTSWIVEPVECVDDWTSQMDTLKEIFELENLGGEADKFLEFDVTYRAGGEDQTAPNNKYLCKNGREITVGTIHSVKGETHDATLILETQYRKLFDCSKMLPFMLDTTKKRPTYTPENPNKNESILAQYMRKLYVAGSRPRNLLCMALHKDNIDENQKRSLQDRGWSVKVV